MDAITSVILMGAEDALQREFLHCSYAWKSKPKGDRVCCPKCRKSFRNLR
jgi:hypothetical protein